MLDAEEYFHLALHASAEGQHHACIVYLKEVLQRQPQNARAMYLLAVQYAELGLFDRAIAGLTTALGIEPTLETARFQLGLLLLDRNRSEEAKMQLARLDDSPDRALRACAEALTAMADNDLMAAQQKLTLGLSQTSTSTNKALAELMQRLLDKLHSQVAAESVEARDAKILLGAYHNELS